jgi:hypothetical protein
VLVVESPGIAVSAAADALALAPNTLSTLVSVLLRAGLIERGTDGRDRRVAALRPSPWPRCSGRPPPSSANAADDQRAASQAAARSAAAAARPMRKWSADSMTSIVVSGHAPTIGATAAGGAKLSNAGTSTRVGSGGGETTSNTVNGGAMTTRAVTAGCSTPSPTAAPNE